MPCEVVVVGAGPAGSLTAYLLARQGHRVRLFDRTRFPRDKLCGDTLNPGAMRVLSRYLSTATIEAQGLPIQGMVLTGPRTRVVGDYPAGLTALSLRRRHLDEWLLSQALAAGVQFEDCTAISAPLVDGVDGQVRGVVVHGRNSTQHRVEAKLVIAADGRESRLARYFGLATVPRGIRRWAIGGYFEGVDGTSPRGEMHVRRGHYIGVAPVPGGLTNACLVLPFAGGERLGTPADRLQQALAGDSLLRDRFRSARLVARPMVLGPVAVNVHAAGVPGLLLAGDSAGFIDPMTGDGLRFALHGAVLAATVASEMLSGELTTQAAAAALAARRRAAFARKQQFDRALRQLVARPAAVGAAAACARAAPGVFRAIIRYAGDCAEGFRGY